MKLLAYLLLFSATLSSPLFGQSKTKVDPTEEKAVKATIQAMIKSWTNHNYDDIANWTTPDVDWINIVGMHWKGREAMRLAHQTYHDGMFKKTPWTLKKDNNSLYPTRCGYRSGAVPRWGFLPPGRNRSRRQ